MAGVLVPVVMMRKFTALTGAADYSTVAIEVSDYQKAILSAWHGPVLNGGTLVFSFEQSMDQKTWTICSGTTGGWTPGPGAEGQVTATLSKRWFRVRATLTEANASATCWVLGFLERREP
jgi:hypothetical protein